MRCPDATPRRDARFRAALASAMAVVALAACGSETNQREPAPHWTYTSTLTATPGPLTPEQPAPNSLEDRAEVQALRDTAAMTAWAVLMNTCDSDEFARVVDSAHINPCAIRNRSSDPIRAIGPSAFTPIAVTESPTGAIEVAVCAVDSAASYGDLSTRAMSSEDHYRKFAVTDTLSPLTDEERAAVLATGMEPPAYWVRSSDWNDERYSDEQCKDVEVVTQVFVDWKDTYLFARPYATPQTVPRDEMP